MRQNNNIPFWAIHVQIIHIQFWMNENCSPVPKLRFTSRTFRFSFLSFSPKILLFRKPVSKNDNKPNRYLTNEVDEWRENRRTRQAHRNLKQNNINESHRELAQYHILYFWLPFHNSNSTHTSTNTREFYYIWRIWKRETFINFTSETTFFDQICSCQRINDCRLKLFQLQFWRECFLSLSLSRFFSHWQYWINFSGLSLKWAKYEHGIRNTNRVHGKSLLFGDRYTIFMKMVTWCNVMWCDEKRTPIHWTQEPCINLYGGAVAERK